MHLFCIETGVIILNEYSAIDLFAGCGGMSVGINKAGFSIVAAVEINKHAARVYKLNHKNVTVFENDIRDIDVSRIKELLKGKPLHLLAGCPPCQGFSTIRSRNKSTAVEDERNNLIDEFLRFVTELKPLAVMLENVPGLIKYNKFNCFYDALTDMGYDISYSVVDLSDYGVPQRRKRLVLIGTLNGTVNIPQKSKVRMTVYDAIGHIEPASETQDQLHKLFPTHTNRIKKKISYIPKNGGSQKDLPKEYRLQCHQKENIGFSDVYGRMSWDDVAPTITGGCLNPSKGRFLHPEENRCISAREAALIQTFPREYVFPTDIPKSAIASMIGNALPPLFSHIQCSSIKNHLMEAAKSYEK